MRSDEIEMKKIKNKPILFKKNDPKKKEFNLFKALKDVIKT
jgi:hypothetical protein